MKTSLSGKRKSARSLFEGLENRLLFAFGDADTDFGVAGRATAGFSSTSRTPAITQLITLSGGKILSAGTTGIAQFTSAGAVDSSFGTSGKIVFPNAATFVADAVDPTTGNIYALVSAPSGTGIFRYTSAGKLDTTFGSGGTATVTTSKTFIPQSIAVQSDGKPIIAGVFKTDSNNGRKVRLYRLKADGTAADTSFNSTGILEFNFGQSSFLASTVYDKVAAVKILSTGKIDVIGGSVDYTPAFTDPDTGNNTDATFDKGIFAIARIKTDGTLDSTYGSSGITRDDYATADQIQNIGINGVLPNAAAVRGDDSVIVAGYDGNAVVAEFDASGTAKYTTDSGTSSPELQTPLALTTLSDGRAIMMGQGRQTGEGFALVQVASDGTLSNIVYTSDNDSGTDDIYYYANGGALGTASNGEILAGGGDANSAFIVEEIKAGNVSDKRPDEFANARANSIKIDTNGGIHLAYYDAATTHLVYVARNPNGVWDDPVVIDSGAYAGQYVALDLNSKNNPGIAYFDGNAGDLKFALNDGSSWHTETVDSKGSVGLYPSFDFDNADEPVVTYFNKTKGTLTFALKKGNTKWGYENVDSSGDNVGRSSSLVASPKTGRYTVAYVDNTTGSVMWAGHQKGGTWDVKVAAKTKGSADFLSMSYGYYYEPMISYYDAYAADLKITSYYNGQFNIKTLATSGAQGLYSSALFGNYYGSGSVFAYNRSQDKITLFDGAENTTPNNSDVVTGGGKYLSVASSGVDTVLAYYDAAAGVLKVRSGPAVQG